jgi:low temperature requirement protein LtrA
LFAAVKAAVRSFVRAFGPIGLGFAVCFVSVKVSRGAMKLWASNIDKCDEYSKKGLCDRKLCAVPRTHPC